MNAIQIVKRERERIHFHKPTRIIFLILGFGVPVFFMIMANESALNTLVRSLLNMWFFSIVGLITTYFPLYILTDDKMYFFTSKKLLKKISSRWYSF